MTETAYEQLENLLAQSIGLDPSVLGLAMIRRAADRRMEARGIDDPLAYADEVAGSDDELQALIDEVVVPESWFFRDERPFEVLKAFAVEPASRSVARPFRVLSIPCAGGEEPYSIAVALLDAGLGAERFRIDAVDISLKALKRAESGVYRKIAFRTPLRSSLRRFFHDEPGGEARVDDVVKQSVRFLHGNLLDPGLLSDQLPYDAIFCKNLLIYLDENSRAVAIEAINRLLARDGLLFVGHAEALAILAPRFEAVGEPGSFAYRRPQAKGTRPATSLALKPRPAPRPRSAPPARRRLPAAESPRTEPLRRTDGDGSLDRQATPGPAAVALLEQASAAANREHWSEAVGFCDRAIREEGPTAEAFYLLGTVHQASGSPGRAEECFHRAVYLDAEHDGSLLALALIARQRGDSFAETNYRRRARRAAERNTET